MRKKEGTSLFLAGTRHQSPGSCYIGSSHAYHSLHNQSAFSFTKIPDHRHWFGFKLAWTCLCHIAVYLIHKNHAQGKFSYSIQIITLLFTCPKCKQFYTGPTTHNCRPYSTQETRFGIQRLCSTCMITESSTKCLPPPLRLRLERLISRWENFKLTRLSELKVGKTQ